jgi:hypothetical protein
MTFSYGGGSQRPAPFSLPARCRVRASNGDLPPSEAGEQREVRPAVESQDSKATSSPPPHEGAGFLVQPAMLRSRDLEGRALDNRPQLFAGEPTDLDAEALGLRVELRPVGDARGRRVEEPKQEACRTVVDIGPRLGGHHAALASQVQLTPITG